MRGDVEALYNDEGTLVARYVYDSWGKVLGVYDSTGAKNTSEAFIGNINPIRYRGYYYDVETGFYYLGSRYYDPEVGRFISADTTDVLTLDIGSVYQKNLYAYCCNNRVNYYDNTVELATVAAKISWIVVDVVINVGASWIAAKATGQEFTKEDAATTAIMTAIGSLSKSANLLSAFYSGVLAACDSLEAGDDARTALLIGGATAIGSYVTMNTLMDIAKFDVSDAVKAVSSATFESGSILTTAAVTAGIKQNKKNNKVVGKMKVQKSMHKNNNYIKVTNGKLMR